MNRLIFRFCLLSLLLWSNTTFSIEPTLKESNDSLLNLLKSNSNDTTRINALRNLAWEAIDNSDLKQALEYSNKALELLNENPKDQKSDLNPQWRKKTIGSFFDIHGMIHWYKSDFDKALEYYFKGLKIHEEMGNKERMAASYNNIGNIHHSSGDYDKALELYFKGLKIFEEIGDKKRLAYCYNNVGIILAYKEETERALEYYMKSLKTKEEIGDERGVADTYNSIAGLYSKRGEKDKALDIYIKSSKIRERIDDKRGLATSYINIGNTFVEQKKFIEGKKHLLSSLKIANSIGYKDGIKETFLSLAQCDSAQGDFKSAFEYYKLFSFYKDSIFNDASSKSIAEIQERYNSEKKDNELIKKDAEINRQNAETKQRASERNLFIIGFAFMLALAFFIFRGYRQKQNANTEISKQNAIINGKQKEILDSILVAQRIQQSLLPTEKYIAKNLHRLKSENKKNNI